MLNRAANELHGSVWAVQGLPLRLFAPPGTPAAPTARASAGQKVMVTVKACGRLGPEPDFEVGTLIPAAHEAGHMRASLPEDGH